MRISRPNIAELARTFAGVGESDSKAPPVTSLDVPPTITPVMEFCRPIIRDVVGSGPEDGSVGRSLSQAVPQGAGTFSAALMTLRRGVWRLSLGLSAMTTGAAAIFPNYAFLCLANGVTGMIGPGCNIDFGVQNVTVYAAADFLVHLPDDSFTIHLEIDDPGTVGATNRIRYSYLACHLL